jgi:hypothetical protein
MTVGLPGVGIGGIFYLVSALLMPVRELGLAVRGDRSQRRWGVVARQSMIAAGILAALWGTGWLVGRLLMRAPLLSASLAGHSTSGTNAVRVSALALSLGTLSLVLLTTQIVRYVLHRRGGIPRQQLRPMRQATGTLRDVAGYDLEQRDTGTGGRRRYDSGQFRRR